MRRIAAFVFAVSLLATPAAAQDELLASCAALTAVTSPTLPPGQEVPEQVNTQFRFLCGQVVNAISNVQPSFGIAFSGGAHTLGTATTIGRRLGLFPRISVTARFNAALADVPDLLDNFNPTFNSDDELSPMGTVGIPVGAFQGDVTVGLFNGVSLGPTFGGLGAVDLLGSVSYVPVVEQVGLTQEIVNVGIGARVGILQQGLLMPGISVSGMYRTMLDDVAFGDISDGDPAEFSTGLSTMSFRAGVSKGLLMFDVAAGAGYDVYRSNVAFDFELFCPESRCDPEGNVSGDGITLGTPSGIDGQLTTAAWNLYGNVGMSLLLLNIVGELGYQKATDVLNAAALQEAGLPNQAPTVDDLGGGRFFGSIGVRLTL